MVEAFLLTITVLLAIVGPSELVHSLCYFVLKPKTKPRTVLVAYLTEAEAEHQLLSLIEEMRWHGDKYAERLIAVTNELSDEKKNLCRSRFFGKGIFFTDDFGKTNDF